MTKITFIYQLLLNTIALIGNGALLLESVLYFMTRTLNTWSSPFFVEAAVIEMIRIFLIAIKGWSKCSFVSWNPEAPNCD